MATPPRPAPPTHPTPPPPPKPAATHAPGHHDEEVPPDADTNADEVTTTQEDQIARAAEMEAMGVQKWVEEHDERNKPDEQKKQKVVAGVSPTTKDDPGRRP